MLLKSSQTLNISSNFLPPYLSQQTILYCFLNTSGSFAHGLSLESSLSALSWDKSYLASQDPSNFSFLEDSYRPEKKTTFGASQITLQNWPSALSVDPHHVSSCRATQFGAEFSGDIFKMSFFLAQVRNIQIHSEHDHVSYIMAPVHFRFEKESTSSLPPMCESSLSIPCICPHVRMSLTVVTSTTSLVISFPKAEQLSFLLELMSQNTV